MSEIGSRPDKNAVDRDGRSHVRGMKRSFVGGTIAPAARRVLRSMVPAPFFSHALLSRDHNVIGLQYACSAVLWLVMGGLLTWGMGWQPSWPWSETPIAGRMMDWPGSSEVFRGFHLWLRTMFVTVVVFLVFVPLLIGAGGNLLIPRRIGADRLAFPTFSAFGYWLMWPAFACFALSFVVPGTGLVVGWQSVPASAVVWKAVPAGNSAIVLWLVSIVLVGTSSFLMAVNCAITIVQRRTPGLTMARLPPTVWAALVGAILQLLILPALAMAAAVHLSDLLGLTKMLLPEGVLAGDAMASNGGGQPLVWDHLFWFYTCPAVFLLVVPVVVLLIRVVTAWVARCLRRE